MARWIHRNRTTALVLFMAIAAPLLVAGCCCCKTKEMPSATAACRSMMNSKSCKACCTARGANGNAYGFGTGCQCYEVSF